LKSVENQHATDFLGNFNREEALQRVKGNAHGVPIHTIMYTKIAHLKEYNTFLNTDLNHI
jgi:hypothetical protein